MPLPCIQDTIRLSDLLECRRSRAANQRSAEAGSAVRRCHSEVGIRVQWPISQVSTSESIGLVRR